MFIFLQDFRATLIPSIAIPVSLSGTFAVLLAAGLSINNLSLFGLTSVLINSPPAVPIMESICELSSQTMTGCLDRFKMAAVPPNSFSAHENFSTVEGFLVILEARRKIVRPGFAGERGGPIALQPPGNS